MKWIEISKAKPKFGKQYLVATKEGVHLATLGCTKQTSTGVAHEFDNESTNPITNATHIAIVENPNTPLTNQKIVN